MSKNIALFIDGTHNSPDARFMTNVHKLFRAAKACDGAAKDVLGVREAAAGSEQVSYYMKGVGTGGDLDRLFGGITGFGTAAKIREAYLFLARNYQQGDQVYLFGFSRGALAARALANFVGLVGLLFRDSADWEFVAWAYALYERGEPWKDSYKHLLQKLPQADREPVTPMRVHLIGVWDVVKSLGPEPLTNLWARHHDNPRLPAHITHARHALALHDLRPEFQPMLWAEWDPPAQTLQQVWFPGVHSDIGGSYEKAHLSDVTLSWMVRESEALGLKLLHTSLPISQRATSPDDIHYQQLLLSLAPRKILKEWRNLPRNVLESFFMHDTACEQLLQLKIGHRRRVVVESGKKSEEAVELYEAFLEQVDHITLALHLHLSCELGKSPIK